MQCTRLPWERFEWTFRLSLNDQLEAGKLHLAEHDMSYLHNSIADFKDSIQLLMVLVQRTPACV